MELKALLPEELKDRTEIISISVDEHEDMQRMVDRVTEEDGVAPDFIMLSDPDMSVIDRYGLYNPDSSPRRPGPHPATYVIDMEGIVRYRFVEIDYRVRPTNVDILEVLTSF